MFAQATAHRGVRGTLTLPLVCDGEVVGTANLYAASAHAFEDHLDSLSGPNPSWPESTRSISTLRLSLSRYIRDTMLSDAALAEGKGWEDVLSFLDWVDGGME